MSPPTRLVITWATASQAADPAAYSRVTFEIEPYDDMIRLTVIHDELEPAAGWPTKGCRRPNSALVAVHPRASIHRRGVAERQEHILQRQATASGLLLLAQQFRPPLTQKR